MIALVAWLPTTGVMDSGCDVCDWSCSALSLDCAD